MLTCNPDCLLHLGYCSLFVAQGSTVTHAVYMFVQDIDMYKTASVCIFIS